MRMLASRSEQTFLSQLNSERGIILSCAMVVVEARPFESHLTETPP